MNEFALSLRPPVQPGRSRDHHESIDRTDNRCRSPRSLEPRDYRGFDQGRRERDGGPEILTRAVIARFTDVAHDRQPRTPIRAHNQLATEEKQKLGEWLRRSTRATDPNIRATIEDFRNYLNKIFQGWSSEGHHPSGPSSLDCSAFQTSIMVRTLKVNAPLSKVQALTAHPAHNLARIAGEPVFCSVIFNNDMDGVVFTWKDQNGYGVPYDMISFTPSAKRADIRYQAIVTYDRHELQRVGHHNSGIIGAWARHAIGAWARRGSQDDPDIDVLEPRGLLTCVFARDRVIPAGEALMEVGRRLTRDNVLSAPRAPSKSQRH
ncbi:uncharacterized protein FIESC28_10938 [Fusarium coffeatum]|uniref:Uncharacterized protein n=1 Tax=Fusarium coffeatum TaxID=231269 RepID=A0A366QP94_9HYPO|nr:uncharacterized protein FIESC28_10938 [Fusarium coffeatum]RBR06703.1 hypothetical protein FIESC28_10938 [Fusarium coffeatum]